MYDAFDAPATGVKVTDFSGSLLLLTPVEYVESMNTAMGATDVVVCDVVVLDGDHAGEEHPAAMIFPKILKSQLKGKVGTGRQVLGRLGRGVAKPGQSAPWTLATPTEADKDLARAHLARTGTPPAPAPAASSSGAPATFDIQSEIPF